MRPSSTALAPPGDHYENFPVASWLCPASLRPAVAALYWFARTADDIADEGDAPAEQRLADLAAFRADLLALAHRSPVSDRWPQVFGPLAAAMERHRLPLAPFTDLLSAFEQDVVRTREGAGYADRADLLDYCRRSANPVGRLMLHLYGVHDAQAVAESDCVCTALQLINFWQDLGVDLRRGRRYLPEADLRAHGLDPAAPASWRAHPNARRLVADEVAWARATMRQGLAIPHRVPGRAGWELRAVVQGGLRILDKIEAQGFDTFSRRPTLSARDAPVLLWRVLRMGQSAR
ncbi:phytoene synthase-like protein [Ramlibacter tataouinensis TTB310]|uniref:Phytoene synthase-like protein n=1 Tax=Ramlibacter tataouinensis (strain ATCC BAA-407 / DSM 14655 / LMG 21543 / TTB310) TaxID=365046 RepID=F5Y5G9_RAMTT|nr:squalene synthase HpnC [Ramlibacter tataouinensis]AEG92665.1 phytoene synthase-like protein [Ramlibacter tataouinensis TTB310]